MPGLGPASLRAVLERVLPVLAVLACALLAFAAGVDVSERPGLPTAPVAARVYYSIGLFLLGGLDIGVPVGGPAWARTLLWVVYFAAPLITTTAVAEGLIRLASPHRLRPARPRDHLLLVGVGRLGTRYLDVLRADDPDRTVVAVDLAPHAPAVERLEALGVRLVRADIRRPLTASPLGLDHAHGLVLTTDDDLANLAAAFELAKAHPGLVIAAHVADLGLRRNVEELAARARVQLFNTHEITAAHVFDSKLAAHFEHTAARDVVVVAGFGRFGQTLLEHVHRHAPGEVEHVVILDEDASRLARTYADQVGFDPACTWEAIDADLLDPATIGRVQEVLARYDVVPVVLLATNDDRINLQAGVSLRRHLPNARIFVRYLAASDFVRDLEAQYGLEGLRLEGVLSHALREHYRATFGSTGTQRNWWSA